MLVAGEELASAASQALGGAQLKFENISEYVDHPQAALCRETLEF
jgi:hypothetical protein